MRGVRGIRVRRRRERGGRKRPTRAEARRGMARTFAILAAATPQRRTRLSRQHSCRQVASWDGSPGCAVSVPLPAEPGIGEVQRVANEGVVSEPVPVCPELAIAVAVGPATVCSARRLETTPSRVIAAGTPKRVSAEGSASGTRFIRRSVLRHGSLSLPLEGGGKSLVRLKSPQELPAKRTERHPYG